MSFRVLEMNINKFKMRDVYDYKEMRIFMFMLKFIYKINNNKINLFTK